MAEVTPGFPRAWIEFRDPANDNQLIRADLTWLTSKWNCTFGQGCLGIYRSAPDAGCCALGAHLADNADLRRVAKWVGRLTARDWQQRPGGRLTRAAWTEQDEEGARKTRVTEGACILMNGPGFPGGSGCALHILAMRLGESFVETKPDVCWQLPIRRDYEWREDSDGTKRLVVTVTEYVRGMWGAGGHDFDWYCSSNTDAHTAPQPVFRQSRAELEELIGSAAYAELARHCAAHLAARDRMTRAAPPVGPGADLAQHPASAPRPNR
ncbi:MAG: hypothetical protein U0990_04555 [Candidatus Nanopelagicales bacterium]|nr:hypothetical protein [Candidatus Nanopelagicales bacterium]MDZ4249343.1 hypothetical protein [Candidatus Nanopelagicales bacterium]